MRYHSIFAVFMLLALLPSLLGCGEDEGPFDGEKFGEVSGTVTFVGTWSSTGAVQVSIWTVWPPIGAPAAATDPLAVGSAVQSYKIEGLSKGTYTAVTVSWRDPANPAGAKVLGIYWERSDSLGVDGNGNPTVQPMPIEVSDEKLVWSNADIRADLDIVP